LNDDPKRQRVLTLQDQLSQLQQKRDVVADEMLKNPLGGPEERAALLAKVKADGAAIQETEQQLKECEELTVKLREQVTQLDVDLAEVQGMSMVFAVFDVLM